MSPVLVTGGAGFIGSHLVRLLVARGEGVRVLERPGARVAHLPLDRIDLAVVDVRDRDAVAAAVRGCREVYHLAANPQLWTRRRRSEERRVGKECRGRSSRCRPTQSTMRAPGTAW